MLIFNYGDEMKKKLEALKNLYSNNKQKINFFGSIVLIMIAIIIVIAIAVKMVGNKTSYEDLETILEDAAARYLNETSGELPTELHPTVVVTSDTLVEKKYVKELSKYVKDSSCTANVLVDYNKNNYKYQTYLTCNNFKTEKFMDVLKNNNKISQTGEGLYEINGELVFRGQNPNNYVKFNDELWRIVKVDKSGNIRIIITEPLEDDDIYGVWDDRYNAEDDGNVGVNNYNVSRALITTKSYYERKYLPKEQYLAKFDLCVGKRAKDSTDKSGSLECNELIRNQDIGLLPLYDYMNVSLDGLCKTSMSKECQNYNYLVTENNRWWTMTGSLETTYHAFSVNPYGEIDTDYTSYTSDLRYVITLNGDVLFKSGNGTYDSPYEIR